VALNFSETAKEKLKNSGSQVLTIIEEIKSNPEAKGLKVLTRK
jgi:ribosomal protein L18E